MKSYPLRIALFSPAAYQLSKPPLFPPTTVLSSPRMIWLLWCVTIVLKMIQRIPAALQNQLVHRNPRLSMQLDELPVHPLGKTDCLGNVSRAELSLPIRLKHQLHHLICHLLYRTSPAKKYRQNR